MPGGGSGRAARATRHRQEVGQRRWNAAAAGVLVFGLRHRSCARSRVRSCRRELRHPRRKAVGQRRLDAGATSRRPPLLALPSPCPMCSSSLFAASGTKPSEAPGASAGDLGPTPGSTGAREPRRCTSTLLIGNYAAGGVTQVGRCPAGATSSRPQAGPRAGSRRHCAMTIGLRAGSRSVSRRCARPPRPACRKTRRVPTVRSAPFFAGRYGSADGRRHPRPGHVLPGQGIRSHQTEHVRPGRARRPGSGTGVVDPFSFHNKGVDVGGSSAPPARMQIGASLWRRDRAKPEACGGRTPSVPGQPRQPCGPPGPGGIASRDLAEAMPYMTQPNIVHAEA